MEADPTKACNQDDATGFIWLNGLRLKVAAKVQRGKYSPHLRHAYSMWRRYGIYN